MLGRRLGGATAGLVLALCALVPPVALGDEDEGSHQLFSIKASHGYRMIVSADAERDDGRGQVVLFLVDKGLHRVAYYLSKGFVTDTRLKANFGALGRIDLEPHASGKEGQFRAHAPCNGTTEGYERATYRGSLEFRGEEGFTTARASRIAASPQAWVDLVCSNHFEVDIEDLEPGVVGADLHAELKRRRARTEFEATKNRPGGHTVISASVAEKRHGIVIVRAVQFLVGAAAFSYDAPLSKAAVNPPAPFFGSASYRAGIGPAKGWTGNLTVDLPGRADVPLTRPGLKATLIPAAWSVEPPEFE